MILRSGRRCPGARCLLPGLLLALQVLAGPLSGQASPADPAAAETLTIADVALRRVPEPGPEAERLSDADREQIRTQHRVVEGLLTSGEPPQEELANAYGRLGQIYYAYDILNSATIAFENARALAPEQFGWHYYLGTIDVAEGRLERALERFGRSAELAPGDVPSWIRIGRVNLDLGRPDAAEAAFEQALELDPESAAAHHGLGEVRREQGRIDEAIERYERALELQPDASSIHHRLGLAYRKAGDLDQARAHLALNRSDPVLFDDPLIEVLERFFHDSRPHVKAGNDALEAGDLERALEEYRLAVEADPEDSLAHYNLGFALARAGEVEKARTHYLEAIDLQPDFRNAHFNLAASLAAEGRWKEAAEHYRRVVEIDPEDFTGRLELAAALAATGDRVGAREVLETVLEEAAGYDADVRSRAAVQLGRQAEAAGRPAEAEERFRQAVEIDPESILAHRVLARFLGRAGRFGDAAEELGRVVELAPEDLQARFGRATALLLGGDERRARATLQADLQQVAALPLAHVLARLLATATDPAVRDGALALELATRIYEQRPSVDHAETVAMAYAETGDFEQAVEWQRRALEGAEGEAAAERVRRRLAAYERGEPVRAPWRGGDAAP